MGAHRAAHRQVFAAAEDGDVLPSAGFGVAGQEAPGFAVFFVFGSSVPSRVETQCSSTLESLHRDDVPNVFRDYVRCYEVDVVFGVASPARPRSYLASPPVMTGALHLHAPKPAAHAHQHVIGIDIPQGFATRKSYSQARATNAASSASPLRPAAWASYGVERDWPRGWVVRDADALAGCD